MLNLILKDIFVLKKSFLTAVLYAAIMVIAFQSVQGNSAYIIGALGVVFILITGIFAYEEKSKGDILINSLPVSRIEIVIARYLSLLVFSIFAIIAMAVVGLAINSTGLPIKISPLGILDIASIYIVLTLMYSIYMPIYYKFGYIKSRFVSIILYIALFAVSGLVSGIMQIVSENRNEQPVKNILLMLNNIPDWAIGPIFIITIILILLLSLAVSIKFYRKREF